MSRCVVGGQVFASRFTAGLLGILGVWFLIEEIRNDILDADGATVIGAILFWAASIVSGVGAWQLMRK